MSCVHEMMSVPYAAIIIIIIIVCCYAECHCASLPGCGVGVPRVWILARAKVGVLIFKNPGLGVLPEKRTAFWIFMYLLQCRIIFVQLDWTCTSNLNFVYVILCTVLEHAMT